MPPSTRQHVVSHVARVWASNEDRCASQVGRARTRVAAKRRMLAV